MKLTAILILVASLQVSARGYTQENITLNEKNAELTTVFKKITKQTGVHFVHRDEWVKNAKPVSISVQNKDLNTVLQILFQMQPGLTYERVSENIVTVRQKEEKKEKDENNNTNTSASPPIDVHGRVLNEKGNPVEGVTVTVKGSKQATSTNGNGEFSLNTVDPNAVLVFTSVNMETFELEVSGKTELIVSLKTKITALGDVVVVNTGYQNLKPNEVTGSVVVLSKEQLDTRVAPDIISKLEGMASELTFNRSFSGKLSLRIRGESTIFGNSDPLIVVDNFQFDGDISNINPNDVESVTVLKDAAATSIYGIQAGNGVIVITTKRGRLNQPLRVELNTNMTVTSRPNLFYSPQISSSDFIDFETFLFSKGYYNADLIDVNKKVVSPVVEILSNRKLGLISSADSMAQIDALRNLDIRNDISDYLYQKALHQQYQVNLNGGSNRAAYYFSAGYDRSTSNRVGENRNRFTINSQTSYTALRNLELKAGIVYAESKSTGNAEDMSNTFPYQQLVDQNGNELSIPQRRAKFEDTIATHNFLNWKYYPLKEQKLKDITKNTFDTRLNAGLKYTVIRGLTIDVSYQYQRAVTRDRRHVPKESYGMRNNFNRYAIISNGNYVGTNYPNGGLLDLSTGELLGHYFRATVNFNRVWTDHSLHAIAGSEVRKVVTESNSSLFYGYDDKTGIFIVPNLFTSYPTYPTGNSTLGGNAASGLSYAGTDDRFRTFFSNAAYTFLERYALSGSLRLDGSNYFGVKTNKKTVPLWSMGLKWDINKEKFMSLPQLEYLTLRTTYGFQGNMAQNMTAITTLRYSGNSAFTGLPYAGLNNIPNPELRWEKTAQLNFGLDWALKNSKISGTIEYFKKNGNDLIGDALVDPTTGVTQLRGNFSGMKSSGVNIQISSRVVNKEFQWNSTFFFNYVNEIITRYDIPNSSGYSYFINNFQGINPIVGRPLYALYSFRWGGLDPGTGDPRIILGDTLNKTYTANQLNLVSDKDLIYSGKYFAPISGSFMNNLSYKGVSLSFNISYKLNYYFRRNSISYSRLLPAGGWKSSHSDYALRWKKPGDEANTNVPSFVYPDASGGRRDFFYNYSNILIEKGDHVRLQFVNVSYNFNAKVLKRLKLRNLQLYFYVNNVCLIWRANEHGIDPEYPFSEYPTPRSYSGGVRLNF